MNHLTIRHNGKTYPARELTIDGSIWLISTGQVEQTASSEVDDMIGFYVPEKDFLQASDAELVAMIEGAM